MLKPVKLKYYKNNGKNKFSDVQCFICGRNNIIIGSMYNDKKDKQKFVCEDCTIDIYKEEYGFKSRKEAAARRRRIFDVGYLFNEILLDIYMEENGIENFKDIPPEDFNFLIEGFNGLYNKLFSKEEKEKIEVMNQEEIEKIFKSKLTSKGE